jgi:hypothetical protein
LRLSDDKEGICSYMYGITFDVVLLLGNFRRAPHPSDTRGRPCALLLPRGKPCPLKKKKKLFLFFKFFGNL